MVHYLTNGHPGVIYEHQISREDDYKDGPHLPYETLEAVEIERHAAGFHLVGRDLVLDVQLLLPLNLFPVEGLYDVNGINDVLYALALGFKVGSHLPAPSLEPFCLPHRYPEIHRDNAKGHKAHIDVCRKHEDKRKGGACEKGQKVYEEVLDRAGEAANALVNTCLDLAGGVFIGTEKGHPEGEDLLNYCLRQVPGHEYAHALAVVVLRKGYKGR